MYTEVITDGNNIDIAPYIFEIVMHGLRDFGINFKLNKKNRNEIQSAFFQNLSTLHKEGLFQEKQEEIFINNIIKRTNPLIKYYGMIGYTAHIFLLIMLEAKYKFWDSPNKIKNHVYSKMRKLNLPIDDYLYY
ncbi:MAG: hypothetical protein GY932_06610 [Arcobacter sp.]|nr:hypothetical protein [Arcobacter sp.]